MYIVTDERIYVETQIGWDERPRLFNTEESARAYITALLAEIESESIRYIKDELIPCMYQEDFDHHAYGGYFMEDDKRNLLPEPRYGILKPYHFVWKHSETFDIKKVQEHVLKCKITLYSVEIEPDLSKEVQNDHINP